MSTKELEIIENLVRRGAWACAMVCCDEWNIPDWVLDDIMLSVENEKKEAAKKKKTGK